MAIKGDHKTCFVVGPIGQKGSPERTHADWVLKGILLPAFEEFPQYELIRADGINEPGLIDSQIIDHLLNADLVIADLTTMNPNAFYEIGIRHVVQKPIIHMHLMGMTPPFDVSLFRSIPFSVSHPDHLAEAQEQVAAMVRRVEEGAAVENPVTRARGRVHFEATATPAEMQMREDLDALQLAVRSLTQMVVPGLASERAALYSIEPDNAEMVDRVLRYLRDVAPPAEVISGSLGTMLAYDQPLSTKVLQGVAKRGGSLIEQGR